MCTRDRGDSIVKTISTILQSDYPEFDVLIIDQSEGDATLDALQPFLSDARVRYLRSTEVGVSRSRTLGLVEATNELVLMTDDDCAVPPEWVRANVAAMLSADAPAIVFGDVVVPADDDSPGYTPQSVAEHDFVVTSLAHWKVTNDGVNVGIGASMAIRRSVGLAIGGFDHHLGPGSALRNAEDTDLTLRTVLNGHAVMHTRSASVDHYGARSHDDFRSLTRGAMLGLGAMSGKLVRWKPLPMMRFIFGLYWRLVVRDGVKALVRFRKPPVLGRAVYLTKGIWIGLRKPVDSKHHVFQDAGNRVTFVMEQQVGLKSYSDNLRRFMDRDTRLEPSWAPITYEDPGGIIERLPLLPASVRGPLRGRAQVRRALRNTTADACLFLTQTPVSLGGRLARRRPYVVMVDDTPELYDKMAEHYGESSGGAGPIAVFKHRISAKGLRGAHRVLPMSNWARSSLVADYGVDPDRISVIPTGIDLEVWRPRVEPHDGPPRILFVGGHLERKGGPILLEAFGRLPPGSAELHIVTRSELPSTQGVHVHRGLQPNSPELIELFARSDIFVLPSLAEAFPNVVVEACASGLPAIVTDVGGMAEMVVDGETGFVIPPQDVDELERRLRLLVSDAELRATMARASRARAEKLYDGRTNAGLVADCLLDACRRT